MTISKKAFILAVLGVMALGLILFYSQVSAASAEAENETQEMSYQNIVTAEELIGINKKRFAELEEQKLKIIGEQRNLNKTNNILRDYVSKK